VPVRLFLHDLSGNRSDARFDAGGFSESKRKIKKEEARKHWTGRAKDFPDTKYIR